MNESYVSKIFKIGTAGFIKEDGTFLYADENEESYHGGFEEEILDKNYPEFSNTHPEEDTCIRLFKEPNEIQYKKLEEVIDTYLDFEQYCKIEIWNKGKYDFYKVYSLVEDACEDNSWEEEIGNWTGYKLVQIIKNYFNNINENKKTGIFSIINESSRSTLLSKSKSADKYANGKGSRWTAKGKCSVANTVKDYNKIDMNSFWKDDKLIFGIKVVGETNEYVVTISFSNILDKIQRKIRDNKELLEFKCIYDALIQAINSGDIKISCTCPDYQYRLKYWNSQSGDEAGEKETRASDITNPENSKGPACKHILAVLNNVEWLNKIASVINNYANYCKDNMQYNYSKFIFPKLYGMPYNKAVQMSLEDYDENGEIKNTLGSEEALINLSNALGKERGKFKKGSNKNPASKKNDEEEK